MGLGLTNVQRKKLLCYKTVDKLPSVARVMKSRVVWRNERATQMWETTGVCRGVREDFWKVAALRRRVTLRWT